MNSVSGLYLHPRDTSLKLNLSLDMCRWLIEDGDVEVIHEALVKHHLYWTVRPLHRPWVLQLLPLHRLVQLVAKEV